VVIPRQGDVFWAEVERQRRPVLVVTRSRAVPVLHRILIAPITRTIRNIPTEIALGPDEGLREHCVANFDSIQPLYPSMLSQRVGSLGPRRGEICRALSALADC
jgi:mRNA interferase MazF